MGTFLRYELTSSQLEVLKWIAVVTMTLDHVGVFFLDGNILFTPFRIIGRMAFPIFAFLVAYHLYYYSLNKMSNYIKRMFWFAVISQVAFIFAYGVKGFPILLNILFQFLAFSVLIYCIRSANNMKQAQDKQHKWRWLGIFTGLFLIFIISSAAEYGLGGIILCSTCYAYFYLAESFKKIGKIIGALLILLSSIAVNFGIVFYGANAFWSMLVTLVFTVVVLVFMPSVKLKIQIKRMPKYFFYIYYPVHLILLSMSAKVIN
ncbi:hypothetical protein BWD09_10360 [Neisseria dentiae]|uniref:Conjugal transfer protein TraX n=1 Tax=Neisseria dentiae TaxID=194197 RepID=A0A1X3D3W6_9NEIS|nr:TraX family protein [Neisseria dentiae]OSI14496.1 hypothetical protein BWD09_10360 [Neisseria dentiae]QMT44343.1 hypothetical protein H3L92_07590 [Neisseria dentiae]STZ50029.1 conjugal transfer protein TrbP [Neisseria dentiae]